MARYASSLVLLTADTPVTVWQTRTAAKIVKILVRNSDVSDHVLYIGQLTTDGGKAQRLPGLVVKAGENLVLGEDDIPSVVFAATKTMQKDIVAWLDGATASPVELVVEVEDGQ